jgi:hypothetical protein
MYSRKKSLPPSRVDPKELVAALPDILSVVFGKAISSDLSNAISKIEDKLPEAEGFIEAMERAKKLTDTASRKAASCQSTDSFIRSFVGNVPPGVSPIEHVIGELDKLAASPTDLGFLTHTSYPSASETLDRLVKSAYSKPDSIVVFVDSVDAGSIEPSLAVGQMMSSRIARGIKPLTKPRSRYTKRVAEVCIGLYGDLAGAVEKGLPLAVGLIEIIDGKAADYTEIAGRSFAKNIKTIKVSPYGALAPGFDTITIRNALAHKSYYFDPVKRIVKFDDLPGRRSEELKYKDLVSRTLDLCALVLVTHQLRFKLVLAQLKSIGNILKSSDLSSS